MRHLLAAALVGLCLATSTFGRVEQRWYVMQMMGQPMGWMLLEQQRADGKITSTWQNHIAVARDGQEMTIELSGTFVETAQGKPLSASSHTKMAMFEQTSKWVFDGNTVQMTNTTAGNASQSSVAIEGDWLTPAAAMRYVEAHLAAGAKQIKYATVDPMVGPRPQQMVMDVIGQEPVEVYGKTVPATKVKLATSFAPNIQSEGYIDEKGRPLRAKINAGGLSISILAADEALAKTKHKAPELLAAMLVKPDKRIAKPRELKEATYILRLTDGEKLELATFGGAQTASMLDDGSVKVTVDLTHMPAGEPDKAMKLDNSSVIDGRDAKVIALKNKAVADAGQKPLARARAMRQFVYDFIQKKNLGVGFATASEVARTAQGDCTEHAVLLAAMLRADGIPSRVVSGLVYVDQAMGAKQTFGYHMWTQGWLGGRWVDLDPTLKNVDFDATHVALSVSTMADGRWTNDLVLLSPLIGKLKIEVGP